ncbi:MAG: helix-turn-helix domain-containing protein [Eubacteriales bacterium]|nr:helix-turn-helix domain-containing protein [Eubacteriales bacterium]
MISNQILQSTIEGLKRITKTDFGVYDVEGKLLVSTTANMDATHTDLLNFAQSQADSQTVKGLQFFKVYDEHQLEYFLIASGADENLLVGKMATFQLQSLLTAYKERFDKDNFIKNLLLDNLLLVDIYNRAKKLHISSEARRVVYILEASAYTDKQGHLESIKNIFSAKSGDFITAIDEKSVIIVKELGPDEGYEEAERFAGYILSMIGGGVDDDAHIAYGTIVRELKEVSRSYKEARMALDVGKIFFDGRKIIAYSSLGIGRLIYQLPIPLCKMFIREIFANKSPDDFDEETLVTINKFFENNLNVSETSRQLYIHRNTLVYRLDKLQKSTGLDLRVFEDAITFKIALMVVKYMKYMETLEY